MVNLTLKMAPHSNSTFLQNIRCSLYQHFKFPSLHRSLALKTLTADVNNMNHLTEAQLNILLHPLIAAAPRFAQQNSRSCHSTGSAQECEQSRDKELIGVTSGTTNSPNRNLNWHVVATPIQGGLALQIHRTQRNRSQSRGDTTGMPTRGKVSLKSDRQCGLCGL